MDFKLTYKDVAFNSIFSSDHQMLSSDSDTDLANTDGDSITLTLDEKLRIYSP